MRIGSFMYHTFTPSPFGMAVFYGQTGMRIGGIVNVLPGTPIP